MILLIGVSIVWHNLLVDGGKDTVETKLTYALIGDIGGTNIRYQVVQFTEQEVKVVSSRQVKVRDYETFQESVREFLANVTQAEFPTVAVIAIAGPVDNNSAIMSNVPKWGRLYGSSMSLEFNIS